ncbi:MAG: hypothetical protein HY824_08200 [Acidobacteria bacterium]|nr:hypothetical protein [Acidobacteriota bacterium]
MLQWFRARASCTAVAAMLAMATVGSAAIVPHEDDCHDAACRSVAVVHDASAHRIGAAVPAQDDHPLHCLVCHWVRAFRPRAEARIVSTLSAAARLTVPVQFFVTSAGPQVSQPPLRSPPV